MRKRLLVLSGLSSRVADKLESRLATLVDRVAIVTTVQKTGEGDFDHAYFNALANRAHVLLRMIPASLSENILSGFLASFLADGDAAKLEQEAFFPALKRIQLNPALRNDMGQLATIYEKIDDGIRQYENDKNFAKQISKDRRYLLPYRNIRIDILKSNFIEIYNNSRSRFSAKLEKKIYPERGNGGIDVKGGLTFKGTENSGKHPIRRKSDCPCCDLQARFRFGRLVNEHFEFDVTAKTELHGKSFHYCNGTGVRVTGGPDHLNMRINGDFEPAHR